MTKKVLSYVALSALGVSIILLLIALFSESVTITGFYAKLVATAGTLTVAPSVALNSITLLVDKKNKISYVSLGLIVVSGLMFLILFWAGIGFGSVAVKICLTLAILSVTINIIVGDILRLGKKFLYIQIPTYAFFAIFDFFIIALIFGSQMLGKNGIFQLFIAVIILALGGIIALAVLSKKQDDNFKTATKQSEEMVTISKQEYDNLKARIAELEKQLNDKK